MKLDVTLRDACALLGIALMGAGGWLRDPALGLILAGAALFALAVLGSLRGPPGK